VEGARMKEQYRQGDLLFIKTENPKTIYSEIEHGIIEEGSITGHKHKLVNGKLYNSNIGKVILADNNTMVIHEEHNTIILPDGYYRVIKQREYVSKDESRYVYD
jgi:hypothetical protein